MADLVDLRVVLGDRVQAAALAAARSPEPAVEAAVQPHLDGHTGRRAAGLILYRRVHASALRHMRITALQAACGKSGG